MRVPPGFPSLAGRGFGALAVLALPWVTQLDFGAASLRGLTAVAVLAEETNPDVAPLGVTPASLALRVTTALRRDSIAVLERPDALSSRRQPVLVVRLETVRLDETRTFAWRLSLALCQRVALLGVPGETLAETWSATTSVGATSAPRLARAIGRTLDGQIAEFVTAWRDSARTR